MRAVAFALAFAVVLVGALAQCPEGLCQNGGTCVPGTPDTCICPVSSTGEDCSTSTNCGNAPFHAIQPPQPEDYIGRSKTIMTPERIFSGAYLPAEDASAVVITERVIDSALNAQVVNTTIRLPPERKELADFSATSDFLVMIGSAGLNFQVPKTIYSYWRAENGSWFPAGVLAGYDSKFPPWRIATNGDVVVSTATYTDGEFFSEGVMLTWKVSDRTQPAEYLGETSLNSWFNEYRSIAITPRHCAGTPLVVITRPQSPAIIYVSGGPYAWVASLPVWVPFTWEFSTGSRVALECAYLAVSSANAIMYGVHSGAVMLTTHNGTAPDLTRWIALEAEYQADESCGASLGLSNSTIAIGCPFHRVQEITVGRGFAWNMTAVAEVWAGPGNITAVRPRVYGIGCSAWLDPTAEYRFGETVAVSGDQLVFGGLNLHPLLQYGIPCGPGVGNCDVLSTCIVEPVNREHATCICPPGVSDCVTAGSSSSSSSTSDFVHFNSSSSSSSSTGPRRFSSTGRHSGAEHSARQNKLITFALFVLLDSLQYTQP